jgi:hypothetical protein
VRGDFAAEGVLVGGKRKGEGGKYAATVSGVTPNHESGVIQIPSE